MTGSKRIPLLQKHIDTINAQRERTGLSLNAFLGSFDDIPPKLTERKVRAWLTRTIQTAPEHELSFVLERFKQLPSAAAGSSQKLGAGRIALTPTLRQLLNQEIQRTGVQPSKIVRLKPKNLAPKLKPERITAWRNNRANTAKRSEWAAVIGILAALPDKSPERGVLPTSPYIKNTAGYEPVNEAFIQQLRAEHRRTGISPQGVIRENTQKAPKGLRDHTANAWLTGATKTADPKHMDWLINTYQALADK